MNRILMVLAAGSAEIGKGVDKVGGGDGLEVWDVAQIVINVALWAIGIIAVGFVIFGGIKYAMSQGDAAKAKNARDTIMYAVIGLIVAILAFVIVNFVVGAFGGGGGSESGGDGGGGSPPRTGPGNVQPT